MPSSLWGHDIVQARFTRNGGDAQLQGDVVVNTFVFESDGETASRMAIRDLLDDFYMAPGIGTSSTIRTWLADQLDTLTYYFRQTDAPTGTPGEEIPSVDWEQPVTAVNLPPEFAVCASYRALPPYTARRRGRIYLGPLKATVNSDGVVNPTTIGAIDGAALRLAQESQDAGMPWKIFSRTGDTAAVIEEGYTNNSFDVQRRRDPSTELRLGRHPATWFSIPPAPAP